MADRPFRILVKHAGATFEVESVEALGALLDRLGIGSVGAHSPHVAPVASQALLMVLKKVQESKSGISAHLVATLVGLEGPRGIGASRKIWKRIADEAGFDLDRAMRSVRINQERYWVPGPDLAKAIALLDPAGKAHKKASP